MPGTMAFRETDVSELLESAPDALIAIADVATLLGIKRLDPKSGDIRRGMCCALRDPGKIRQLLAGGQSQEENQETSQRACSSLHCSPHFHQSEGAMLIFQRAVASQAAT